MEIFSQYSSSIQALGAIAVLMLIQVLAVDFIGIKKKHIPGAAIPSDHKLLLFRANRTVANTNEGIGLFTIAFLFAVHSDASPSFVAYSVWGFFSGRAIFAVFYYANLKTLRSISFGFILLSLACLIGAGVVKWL